MIKIYCNCLDTPGTVIGFKGKQKAESLKEQFGTLNINNIAFTTSFPGLSLHLSQFFEIKYKVIK